MTRRILADYRQLIVHFKNLSFWRGVPCAIFNPPATVPSSYTAGFDKTCYPSPKGRSTDTIERSPFFIAVLRHLRRALVRARRRGAHGAFLRIDGLVHSDLRRGKSRQEHAKCGPNKNLPLQSSCARRLPHAPDRISNVPGWVARWAALPCWPLAGQLPRALWSASAPARSAMIWDPADRRASQVQVNQRKWTGGVHPDRANGCFLVCAISASGERI